MSERQLTDVLSEFARTMVTDFPIQAILDHLVERIVDVLPVTSAGVTLISPGTAPSYIAASNQAALRYVRLQADLGEGPCLAAYHTHRPVAVPDLRLDTQFPHFSPHALAAGLAAVFTFPLHHAERPLGALDLYREAPGGLPPDSMDAAQTLADVAAAYLLISQARTDLEALSERSRDASLHDPLTGLPNRVLLVERLGHALRRSRRSDKTTAVLFVDLDRFKTVNDTHGHRVGDALLVEVAARLAAVVRPGDTLARLYGDEFAILCEDLDSPSQADLIVARIGAALAGPFHLAGVVIDVTASVGVAFSDHENGAPEQLLHDADIAMYQEKRAGAGRRGSLDGTPARLAERRAAVARDLHGVAARGSLRIEYQPILDTIEGRPTSAEALVHWAHPDHGVVSPTAPVARAEHPGPIAEIAAAVLRAAWAERQRWTLTDRPDDLAVSVDISPQQLLSTGFAETVAGVLATGDADPHLLTLEVTEEVLAVDCDRAFIVLHDLRDIGVTLALDAYGTGRSSLRGLQQLPVDIVKVDRALVAGLGHRDTAASSVVGAVIRLAHGLGMTVVAEGVETAGQHHALDRLGCDWCQGSFFAGPMAPDALRHLLQQRARVAPSAAGPSLRRKA